MSNIVIQASYTIQSGENIYILTIDDKGNPDLLYAGGSLKAKRLAKDRVPDIENENNLEAIFSKLSEPFKLFMEMDRELMQD